MSRSIHCLGYGGQGSVWAKCLKKSGWNVSLYLPKDGPSFEKASKQKFEVFPIESLSQRLEEHSVGVQRVAFLCPDFLIGKIYREYLAKLNQELRLILAHGYAVYSGDLNQLNDKHQLTLFAPKAIGPYLEIGFNEYFPDSHDFKAAVFGESDELIDELAEGLGFKRENLIQASFEKEAIADLISEQGLLCGTFFPFLSWTMNEMENAGVPKELIREECLSELLFITSILKEKGPSETFSKISAAAKAGTVFMKERLENIGAREALSQQVKEIVDRRFVEKIEKSSWQNEIKKFQQELSK